MLSPFRLPPLLLLCASTVVGGCASLDAAPEYEKARSLVEERTGSPKVYSPATDLAATEEYVSSALTDGLSIEEAVQIAMVNNPRLQTVALQIGVSQADLVQSGLISNPTISLSIGFPDIAGRPNIAGSIAQSLVELWQLPVREKIAQAELERSILELVDAAVDLRADVKTRYYSALAAEIATSRTQETAALVERSFDLARREFAAGETGIQDQNVSHLALLENQITTMSQGRTKEAELTRLGRLLGLARASRPLHLSDPLPSTEYKRASVSDLLLLAMEQRLDAQIAVLNVRAAEAGIRQERLSVVPEVTVGIEAERPDEADSEDSESTGGNTGEDVEKEEIINLLVGPSISFTLPIFDQNQAQIRKAEIIADQRRKELESILDDVAAEVALAALDVDTAQRIALVLINEVLPMAQKNIEVSQLLYEEGEQSIFPLILAQQSFTAQQAEYGRVLAEYAIALTELERAVGGRLEPLKVTGTTDPLESEDLSNAK